MRAGGGDGLLGWSGCWCPRLGGGGDLGCEVLDEEAAVVVEVDEVVVVVEVGESGCEVSAEEVEGVGGEDEEADETDVGDAGAGLCSSAAVWVLWARRVRVRVRASGVRARLPWCPVCVQVLVPRAVPCVVCFGVVGWPWFAG